MKKPYLITYAFSGSADQFEPLFDELKKFPGWWHYIDGTWLVVTDLNATQIFAKLKPHMKPNINLLVIEVGKDRQGWLPKKAWDWFKRYFNTT